MNVFDESLRVSVYPSEISFSPLVTACTISERFKRFAIFPSSERIVANPEVSLASRNVCFSQQMKCPVS